MKLRWWWVLALVVAAVAPTSVVTAAPATEETLAGRLGGTAESFAAIYGQAVARNDANGLHYAVPDFGLVAVQFSTPDERQPVARAIGITLGSNRTPERAAVAPDPADWSLEQARARALDFLPRDAVIGDSIAGDDEVGLPCVSVALDDVFGGRSGGACRAGFILSSDETVSFITLSLAAVAAPSPRATPADRCAGIVDWARQSGTRLGLAVAILVEVGRLSEREPATPARLDGYARQFAAMSAEQRASAPPAEAARASEQLAVAFERYGAGLALAATSLRTEDAETAAEAVATIEAAQSYVAEATALLDEALADCGIQTVESGGSGGRRATATMRATLPAPGWER